MKIAIIDVKKRSCWLPEIKNTATGSTMAAMMELRETIRLGKKNRKNMPKETDASTGNKAISMPVAVATPFPPRNLTNGEKECPKTAHVPENHKDSSNDEGSARGSPTVCSYQ